jgi:hypothetical protein
VGDHVGFLVSWIGSHFGPNPIWEIQYLILALQFDFGDHDAIQDAIIDIDQPGRALAFDDVSSFVQDMVAAHGSQNFFRI